MRTERGPVSKQSIDRNARGKVAKAIINNTIPTILRGNARARRGIAAVELIANPEPGAPYYRTEAAISPTTPRKAQQLQAKPGAEKFAETSEQPGTDARPHVSGASSVATLIVSDTLEAARQIHSKNLALPPHRRPRIAILNMASPLRPGGGVLSGATSQEESLCRRTTLYPSLREEFYRLPEFGAVYTPDVLVFRVDDDMIAKPSDQRDWFFVDVISAAMHRLPEVEGVGEEQRYAEEHDREAAVKKMRAVMQIVKSKDVGQVVLGAWGCGAYGNPIWEIATAWRKVLSRGTGKGKARTAGIGLELGEASEPSILGNMEVYFAIKDARMAEIFQRAFGSDLLKKQPAQVDIDSKDR
ncbi:hypothetical protein jhhlp_008247 [Lomentospora prolificans]|uniref:Microbial-type PARG catalytic domain-containing protein n=1 Tax=Lomentospora prolificans TaxID=41688 RepID=A0A2N3MXH7_9PEZI|nr:hypothetical protein jhhlp_008247 [Lomentospora prolificans]